MKRKLPAKKDEAFAKQILNCFPKGLVEKIEAIDKYIIKEHHAPKQLFFGDEIPEQSRYRFLKENKPSDTAYSDDKTVRQVYTALAKCADIIYKAKLKYEDLLKIGERNTVHNVLVNYVKNSLFAAWSSKKNHSLDKLAELVGISIIDSKDNLVLNIKRGDSDYTCTLDKSFTPNDYSKKHYSLCVAILYNIYKEAAGIKK